MILLMLALVCGLIASVGISQVLNSNKGEQIEMEEILIATQDVEFNTLVTEEMVAVEKWPANKVPRGALKEVSLIEGRRSKMKIYQGDTVLDGKLFRLNESIVASTQIPAGFRVQSVKVDAGSTGGNLIVPGDRVDVIVYMRQTEKGETRVEARTILQDIKVFAVNNIYNAEQVVASEESSTIAAKTISLLVTPGQAEKLVMAEELGKVELTIRSPDDDEVLQGDGATLADIFNVFTTESNRSSEGAIAPPPQQPKGPGFMESMMGMWAQSGQGTGETPIPGMSMEGDKPIWTMELIRGADTTYARFQEGKLLEAVPMSTPAPSANPAAAPAAAAAEATGSSIPGLGDMEFDADDLDLDLGGVGIPDLDEIFNGDS